MPNTTRQNWPYPSESLDPWYDAFEGFVEALDASVYAGREDTNLIVMGGGTVVFDAPTNALTWSAPLELAAPVTGTLWQIPAGQVSISVGEALYATLVRAPLGITTVNVGVASRIPPGDDVIVLAVRRGTTIFFRNGMIAPTGVSTTLSSVMAAAQTNSTATDVAGLVADFNALLAKLRAAGLLAP